MPTRSDVQTLNQANQDIVTLATRDLETFWRVLDTTNPQAALLALRDFVPDLTQTYGEVAATVAADWYDEIREKAAAPTGYRATPAAPMNPDAVVKRTEFGARHLFGKDPGQTLAFLDGMVNEYALKPGRDTISLSAAGDPAKPRWARIPTKAKPCSFCRMLASRGAVYHSEATASGLRRYHGHCGCIASPIWDGDGFPEGYDPDHFLEEYHRARSAADSAGERGVLSVMRRQDAAPNPAEAAFRRKVNEAKAAVKVGPAAEAARQAAAPAARDLPDLDGEALGALQPKRGGWTTKTREQTLKALKATPGGKNLLKTLDSFQSGGSTAIPRMRTDIEKFLAGDSDLPEGRVDSIRTLLGAIRGSDASGKQLFRGMRLPGTTDEVLARYAAGTDVDLSLASFSSDKKLATDFTQKGAGQRVKNAQVPVLIEWVGDRKRALPIENLGKSRVFANEREWVGAGRFRVVSSKVTTRGGVSTVVVQMEQVGTW